MPRDTSGKPVEMAHMARSKEEKKKESMPMERSSGPDYPYGLRVDLDHDGLKKVGMDKLPEVGSEIKLHAKAHVVSARSEKHEGGEERSVGLQITHLGIHHEEGKDEEKSEKSEKTERKRH